MAQILPGVKIIGRAPEGFETRNSYMYSSPPHRKTERLWIETVLPEVFVWSGRGGCQILQRFHDQPHTLRPDLCVRF
eukprot:2634804-Prymnesium_polylepis.1